MNQAYIYDIQQHARCTAEEERPVNGDSSASIIVFSMPVFSRAMVLQDITTQDSGAGELA